MSLLCFIIENMGASSPRDLGRHVHRFGGDAVGSFIHPPLRPFKDHTMAHAIFVDLTHDNKSLFEVCVLWIFLFEG